MLTIGEFSRLTQVPAKTLRYYDTIGLFCPAEVDRFTNYRYYSMTQLPRLYRILALKALGLSLEQIANLLDEDLPPEQIRGMLRLKQAELQEQIAAEQMRLAYVENKLMQIEMEGTMPDYEVVLKDVAEQRVAIARGVAPDIAQIGSSLNKLFASVDAHLQSHDVQCVGYGTTLYYDVEFDRVNIQVGAALPIAADTPLPEASGVASDVLPAQTMAMVVHHGSFDQLENAYDAVLKWIEQHNYRIIGPNREINLAFDPKGNPDDYVTEIQFPVAKRS